ncbi:MAG TPA: amino acid ABC transporter permease [Anaerolineales bacterium]|nr:amino acid ABC transporter permease [Anaerolineales bacterium]
MGSASTNRILAPPSERNTLLGWLRKNLFNSWPNIIISIGSLVVIVYTITGLANWALNTANWQVIPTNLRLFLVGQYPTSQLWRIWLTLHILSAIIGISLGVWSRQRRWLIVITLVLSAGLAMLPFNRSIGLQLVYLALSGALGWGIARIRPALFSRIAIISWSAYFIIFILIIRGFTGDSGLFPIIGSNLWGGLLLTFLLTVVGILFSFPIGIFLALGRQGKLPIVRWFCITFIELVRGVPLVTVLFMAQLMLPLFLPGNVTIDRVIRAMVGITLFSAAYLAENVRGGLQAIPKGQYEAASAMGLNGIQSMVLIILPQALRLIIPILVGQFISLFKDTTLVAIVGLFDLLGISKTVLAQPDFIGLQIEVYIFISALYFIFSYVMSNISQRLEVGLGVGER